MKIKVQLVVCAEDGREEQVQEVAMLEKQYQRIEHLGFTLAEAKSILKTLQQHLVEQQATRAFASWRTNQTLSVHPSFQRQGVGSALLRHLEKRAAELGYRMLRLDTLVVQEAAQQFYRRYGYRCVGRGYKETFEVVFVEKPLVYNHLEV